MDVEGHELKILAASQDLLRDYRLVIVELHPETLGANGMERREDILWSTVCNARQGFIFPRRGCGPKLFSVKLSEENKILI